MKRIYGLMVLLVSVAFAGETLPDEATFANGEEDERLQQRFGAQVMASDELEGLYLQSPVEIGVAPEQGMRSVQGEELYSESDALILERQRMESRSGERVAPLPERPPLPTIPAGVPIRQL
jgi:hypothetical protein